MKDGFIKVCAATPDIKVADCAYNTANILRLITDATNLGTKLIVLPELCITGSSAGDLFFQKNLIDSAKQSVLDIAKETGDIVSVVGFPFQYGSKLYNTAAVLYNGEVIALVPKTNLSAEERRVFSPAGELCYVEFGEYAVPFGRDIIVRDENMNEFALAIEFGDDLSSVIPASSYHALAGATVIASLTAAPELASKTQYRKDIIKTQSAHTVSVYVSAVAGEGESTGDMLYGGENIIAENGTILEKGERFTNSVVYSEPDLQKIVQERIKTTTHEQLADYTTVRTSFTLTETMLTRNISEHPFFPAEKSELNERCAEILEIQSMGLKKRLLHTNAKSVVIGISGGLDSTLALLVAAKAFDKAGLARENITAVTMPCFGTTTRTYNNAINLTTSIGATLVDVDIKKSVLQHFEDIGQDSDSYDVTYENAQARERTQVLMDIANMNGGLVIGTGDMSELALGWATYNGDHMSMYGVNSGVPKTLIRHLVDYSAETAENELLKTTLKDILDTPVSPELLPAKDGEISQKTEDIVGPYSLHDFFLFYMLRYGFSPAKILRLAEIAFKVKADRKTILSWEKVFYRRFFSQQFKRSCVPDGIKVGTVGLSPRGDLKMPSDASWAVWQKEIEELEKR
ncbi:MAG: NAD(+) synthase [Clostridia bacterium]|nr:NAD(+) synthase [Clostridia bacterium]MBQ8637384.1 NAD(+) synthase [Clostridia bacterium]